MFEIIRELAGASQVLWIMTGWGPEDPEAMGARERANVGRLSQVEIARLCRASDLYLRDGGAQFAVQLPMPGFVEERQVTDVFTGTLQEFPQCLRERYRNPDDVRFIVYAVDLESCGR